MQTGEGRTGSSYFHQVIGSAKKRRKSVSRSSHNSRNWTFANAFPFHLTFAFTHSTMKFSLAVLALTGVATPIKADTMLRSAAKTLGVGSPARDYGAFPRLFSVRSQRSTI